MNAFEMIRITLNKISLESWVRKNYESSSVTVASTQTIQWYLRLLFCKCVIFLPLFATLLLIDEVPYVDLDVIVPYFV